MRILIVDDHHGLREGVLRVAEALGYDAVGAADGREALGILREDAPFDVLLTDLRMPEMNGAELLRALDGLEHAPPRRLAFTASEEPHLLAQAHMLADAVLEKPVSLAALRGAILGAGAGAAPPFREASGA